MILKTTEELITDFLERYEAFDFTIDIEHRPIDDNYFMLWYIVKAIIQTESNGYINHIDVQGESYSLDNAIGELNSNASHYRSPKIWPKRVKVSLKGYEDIDNIVMYKK